MDNQRVMIQSQLLHAVAFLDQMIADQQAIGTPLQIIEISISQRNAIMVLVSTINSPTDDSISKIQFCLSHLKDTLLMQ